MPGPALPLTSGPCTVPVIGHWDSRHVLKPNGYPFVFITRFLYNFSADTTREFCIIHTQPK